MTILETQYLETTWYKPWFRNAAAFFSNVRKVYTLNIKRKFGSKAAIAIYLNRKDGCF
jgi:hypothetical protein